MPQEAQLDTLRKGYRQRLNSMPAIRHELGSPYMVRRGTLTEEIFTHFSNTLGQDAGKYRTATSRSSARMSALASDKIPLQTRQFPTTLGTETKSSAPCMVDASPTTSATPHEAHVAVMERIQSTFPEETREGGKDHGKNKRLNRSPNFVAGTKGTAQTLNGTRDALSLLERRETAGATKNGSSGGCSKGIFRKTRRTRRLPKRTPRGTSWTPRPGSITPEEHRVHTWSNNPSATTATRKCRLVSIPTKRGSFECGTRHDRAGTTRT